MRFKGEQRTNTYCTVAGVDLDDVMVFWELERPEPDVNFAGGVVVNGVYFEDEGDISGDMTDAEMASLEERLLESACDDDRGDYLYDLKRDYEMEQRATARSLQSDIDRRYK